MGAYLEKVSSITDYEDENNNIIVGFGDLQITQLKHAFAEVCDDVRALNPMIGNLKEGKGRNFRQKFTRDTEAQAVIRELFDFDQTGTVDFYKFVCGISLINSADLETKAELLWPIYARDVDGVMTKDDLEILIETALMAWSRDAADTIQESVPEVVRKLLKQFGKTQEGSNEKVLTKAQWKEVVANDLTVIKFLWKYGLISKFGGGTDMPEVDSDLEEEIRKGDEDEDQVRIERIKNGIEHSVEKKEDQEDDPTVETEETDVTPWKAVSNKVQPNSYKPFEGEDEPPTAILDMEYVYGFRCHDTRNSLKMGAHLVKNDARYGGQEEEVLLYHTASIGIIQFVKSKNQRFFMEHNDDISCLDVRKQYCVTGQLGSKPTICVWDYTEQKPSSKYLMSGVLTNGIAKVCLNRSLEEPKVAAVALDELHTIVVYDLNKVKEAKEKCIVDPNYAVIAKGSNTRSPCWDLKFTKDDKYVICAGQNEVGFFTYYGNELKKTKAIWDPKMSPQSALCIGLLQSMDDQQDDQESKGGLIATGMYKGEICLWKGGKQVSTIRAHEGPCTSMISRRDKDKNGNDVNGIITGGNDGEVKMWHLRYNKVIQEYSLVLDKQYNLQDEEFSEGLDLQNEKISAVFQSRRGTLIVGTRGSQVVEVEPRKDVLVYGHYEGELKGLTVDPKKNFFYTVGQDGLLASWDMDNHRREDGKIFENPANCIQISPCGRHLAVGSNRGDLNIYDPAKFDKHAYKRDDFKSEILYLQFDPEGRKLIVSYKEKLVWYDTSNDFANFEKSAYTVIKSITDNKHITHIDFSTDGKIIRTNNDANELHFYLVNGKGDSYTDYGVIQSTSWATTNCIYGWDVQGIWPQCSLGTDINAVDRTKNDKVIATGDDFSKIKVFRYPCHKEGAAFSRYSGHAASITNLKFTHDDSRLLSVGGVEKSIIQWRFHFDEESQKAFDEAQKLVMKNKAAAAAAAGDDDDGGIYGEEEVDKGDQAGAVKAAKGNMKDPKGFKPNNKKYNRKPANDLSLHWAHGFRTQYMEKVDETRNMCKFVEGGKVAYATAALGIIYDVKEKKQEFFQKHEEDIISFAMHPNRKIIATGQMAQKGKAKAIDIFVWDAETREVLANFHEFHLRAIIYLEFSPDGQKLLSVGQDDDNSIAIFDWTNKRMIANSKVNKSKVNALIWTGNNEFATTGAGHIKFWTLSGTNLKSKNGSTGGKSFIAQACGTYNKKNKKVYTGGCEGSIFEWNGNSGKNVAENVHGKKNKVGSIVCTDDGILYSGGYDGQVIKWDASGSLKQLQVIIKPGQLTKQVYEKYGEGAVVSLDILDQQLLVGTLTAEIFVGDLEAKDMKCIVNGHYSGETWGACTAPDQDQFCSSGGDKTVRLWDISAKKQLKATVPFKNDIRAIDWAPNGKYIIIADWQAYLYTLNPKNLEVISGPQKTMYGGVKTGRSYHWIEDIKCSPNSKFVATGHHGVSAKSVIEIHAVDEDGKLGKSFVIQAKFTSSILHLDWNNEGTEIYANSQAYETKTYTIEDAENAKKGTITAFDHQKEFDKDNFWYTYTCKIGWPVQGIWQSSDYSDINTVCRSNNRQVLCTGGDDGRVNMFRYPVVVDKQVFKSYIAHSSHVTRVRFTKDDNWLVSTGGNDRTVLLWKTGDGFGGEAIQGTEDEEFSDDEGCGGPKAKKKKDIGKDKPKKEEKKGENELFGEEDVDKGDEFAACKPWLGAIKAPSDFDAKKFKNNSKFPKSALHKEYIWGYRCKDTRNNIRFLSNGKIVYHAAAVGIVLDTETNTQQFFNGHIDDITAMDLHNDQKTVITGEVGPKPNIFVWDAETMKELVNIKKPLQKGIANLQFCPDGSKFAAMAIDVDHQVAVFETKTGNCLHFCDKNPPEKLEISWNGEDSFSTCGPKGLQVWECKEPLKGKVVSFDKKASSKFSTVTTFAGKYIVGCSDGTVQGEGGAPIALKLHGSSVQMVQEAGNVLLSGGNDGVLHGLDKSLKSQWKLSFGDKDADVQLDITNKYAKGLRSASFDNDANPTKLVVGLYCSEIFIFDVKGGKPVAASAQKVMTGHYTPAQQWLNEVWGLDIIKSDEDAFVTCADDCTLRKYSISERKQVAITETILDSKKKPTQPNPKTKDPADSCLGRAVGVSSSGKWAVVGMKDGTCKRFEIKPKGFEFYSAFKHAKEWISDVKFNADDSTLCIGSHDNGIYGYHSKGDKGWKLFKKKMQKHSSYITHIDFSMDGSVLHSNCGAYELLFWDLENQKQNPSGASAYKDEEWQTWTCVLGWPVQGIWPECADGTDINSVDRSPDKSLVATSDDFGTVNIFNYPCLNKGSKCRQGKGHSSHVTTVKWASQQHLITTGGEDQCVILWKVIPGEKDEWEMGNDE